jgi:hypothetical protein
MTNRLVWLDKQKYFNFRDPATGFVYDFQITESMPFDTWLRQVSSKSWVTGEHILQFRELAEVA